MGTIQAKNETKIYEPIYIDSGKDISTVTENEAKDFQESMYFRNIEVLDDINYAYVSDIPKIYYAVHNCNFLWETSWIKIFSHKECG